MSIFCLNSLKITLLSAVVLQTSILATEPSTVRLPLTDQQKEALEKIKKLTPEKIQGVVKRMGAQQERLVKAQNALESGEHQFDSGKDTVTFDKNPDLDENRYPSPKLIAHWLNANGKIPDSIYKVGSYLDKSKIIIQALNAEGASQEKIYIIKINKSKLQSKDKSVEKLRIFFEPADADWKTVYILKFLRPEKGSENLSLNVAESSELSNLSLTDRRFPKIAFAETSGTYQDNKGKQHYFQLIHAAQGRALVDILQEYLQKIKIHTDATTRKKELEEWIEWAKQTVEDLENNVHGPEIDEEKKTQMQKEINEINNNLIVCNQELDKLWDLIPKYYQTLLLNIKELNKAFIATGTALGALHAKFLQGDPKDPSSLTSLTHGDAHLSNIFYDSKTNKVTLIDNATARHSSLAEDIRGFLMLPMLYWSNITHQDEEPFDQLNMAYSYFFKFYYDQFTETDRNAVKKQILEFITNSVDPIENLLLPYLNSDASDYNFTFGDKLEENIKSYLAYHDKEEGKKYIEKMKERLEGLKSFAPMPPLKRKVSSETTH